MTRRLPRRLPLRRRRAAAPLFGAEPSAPTQEPGTVPLPPETTAVHTAAPAPDPSAPAGLEVQPAAPPGGPSFRERGRLRRRLRYLRRVRELGFRDLGGLVFDLHRFRRERAELVAGKLGALAVVDVELRALEKVLSDRQDYVVLREPGIAACPRCAALHGSDANFCPSCGLRLDGPQAMSEVGDAPPAAPHTPLAAPTGQPAVGGDEQSTATRFAVEPGAEPGRSTQGSRERE